MSIDVMYAQTYFVSLTMIVPILSKLILNYYKLVTNLLFLFAKIRCYLVITINRGT